MKSLLATKSIVRALIAGFFILVVLLSRSFAQVPNVPLIETKVDKKLETGRSSVAFLTKNDKPITPITTLEVKGFPNPFTDEVNFAFNTPVKGQGRLQLFTMKGQRMAYVIVKRLKARSSCTITYYIPSTQRVPFIYKFTIAGKSATGVMVPAESVSSRQ
jgi:hypothetical protein